MAVKLKTNFKKGTDEFFGYRDAISGIYDKWYRYHRADDGEAYSRGWNQAIADGYVDSLDNIMILDGQ